MWCPICEIVELERKKKGDKMKRAEKYEDLRKKIKTDSDRDEKMDEIINRMNDVLVKLDEIIIELGYIVQSAAPGEVFADEAFDKFDTKVHEALDAFDEIFK